MLETKIIVLYGKKTAPTDPTQTTLVWFGFYFKSQPNLTKPNCMSFYLAVRMTFSLKTEPNCIANTPKHKYTVNPFHFSFSQQAHKTNRSRRISFLL